jgi:polysaccharide biosynthesis protein PslG
LSTIAGQRPIILLLRALEVLVCLGIVWFVAAPPPILVTLGSPQTVQTTNPKVGVHTRLTDEVETWKIKQTLEMVRAMGAPWVVEYFPWGYIENQKGEFDWSHADDVVANANRQGIKLIARLGYVPQWARPKGTVTSYLDDAHNSDFGDFVGAFAAHFKGRIYGIIIWNEPNTNFEWGERPVDPIGYTALLKIAYERAKEADPGLQVLAGALAPNLAQPGATDTMNDLEYLDKMYAAGAKAYFDTLAVHAYGWKSAAEDPPSTDAINFRRTELLHDIMERYGDGAKHVIVTEGGWNDYAHWTKAVTPPERVQNTLSAFNWCQRTVWIDACVMWAFRFPAPTYTFNDYWTFVTPEFDVKPIYLEVQRYTGNAQ